MSAASGGNGANLVQYSHRKMTGMMVALWIRAGAKTWSICEQ